MARDGDRRALSTAIDIIGAGVLSRWIPTARAADARENLAGAMPMSWLLRRHRGATSGRVLAPAVPPIRIYFKSPFVGEGQRARVPGGRRSQIWVKRQIG